jgi:CHASE3 domain sensor protein
MNTKNLLEDALRRAEENISNFKPQSAQTPPNAGDQENPVTLDIEAIKKEVAANTAKELTSAIYEVLQQMISEGAKKELDAQQLAGKIGTIESEISSIQAILGRNGLS